MTPGKWLLVGGVALAAGILAGVFSLWRERTAPLPSPSVVSAPAEPPSEITLTGTLAARNVVFVPAPVAGTLEMVMVAVGQEVSEGAPLAQIRNTVIEEELRVAQEALERAEARMNSLESRHIAARLEESRAVAEATRARGELEERERAARRQQLLYREGATTRIAFEKAWSDYEAGTREFDAASAAARIATQRVETARRDYDAAREACEELRAETEEIGAELAAALVLAPVTGVVTAMGARQGDEVGAGVEGLFQIAADLTEMEAVVEPAPPDLARIRPGQAASIRIAEVPDVLEGAVREIRDGLVRIDFRNPSPAVGPGMSALVGIRVEPGEPPAPLP